MSRIQVGPVQPGVLARDTDANTTYTSYVQPGALDAANVREAAFDLQHCTNLSIIKNDRTVVLGNAGMLHDSPTTLITGAKSLTPPVRYEVEDSAGNPTFMDLSSGAWTIEPGDALRVFWNLSVKSEFQSSGVTIAQLPWNRANFGLYDIPEGGGGTVTITDGMHCWVMWLEWEVTSSALANWQPVPGQTTFLDTLDSNVGGLLEETAATTCISCWTFFSQGNARDGEIPSGASLGTGQNQGWFAAIGSWAYIPPQLQVTLYGLRLRLAGPMHPMHESSGDERNYLAFDIAAHGYVDDTQLRYKGGRLSAVHMRGS